MRLYATADEERIRAADRVREWTRSGLLEPSQSAAIETGLRTDLKRTNHYLRIALFIFGTIVVGAGFGFWVVAAGVTRSFAFASSAIGAGVAFFVLSQLLVVQTQLYRFGVEEALAVWPVVLLALGAGILMTTVGARDDSALLVASLTAAIAGAFVYWRFGFLYAAFGSVTCTAVAAFYVGLPRSGARLLASLSLLAIFLIARKLRQPHGEDFPGDDYGAIESAAWLGIYAVLNLHLSQPAIWFYRSRPDLPSAFYWATYAAIWLLPAAGLALAIRDRHRWMMWVSLAMAVATLVTNKPYLGWERHTWDPILLGVLLVGTAIGVRRWLSHGPDGHRRGFTPQPLVASADRQAFTVLSTVAGAVQPFTARTPAETAFEPGRGGKSGGAGGGAEF